MRVRTGNYVDHFNHKIRIPRKNNRETLSEARERERFHAERRKADKEAKKTEVKRPIKRPKYQQ